MANHAQAEFQILKKESQDSVVIEFSQEIIALCDKFHKSGQSGGSAPFVAEAIVSTLRKLMLFQPISPLTGGDEEWSDITEMCGEEVTFQNKRDSRVFKYGNGESCKEWSDITEMCGEEVTFQNKRDSRVFKYGNGEACMVSAIVAESENGSCWSGSFWKSKEDLLTGNKDLKIKSAQKIKAFPFTPKTFHVKVSDVQIEGDNYEMCCTDSGQLKKALDYFEK